MLNKIIKKIQEKISEGAESENMGDRIILLDPDALAGVSTSPME